MKGVVERALRSVHRIATEDMLSNHEWATEARHAHGQATTEFCQWREESAAKMPPQIINNAADVSGNNATSQEDDAHSQIDGDISTADWSLDDLSSHELESNDNQPHQLSDSLIGGGHPKRRQRA